MGLTGDPGPITILTVIIEVPVNQWILLYCCQRYVPNMLKRIALLLI